MRTSLQENQRELLQSERLVTIGRMASSISHDLRHHLVAILANAEYLGDERYRNPRRELGLDRTLEDTFPCSDPISSDPNPLISAL
jgi:signal transduction histidine kinase